MCDPPKKPYVSVIKINGVPILPPLITPELRKELSNYKQQAVKLEHRLRTCKELQRNLDELLSKSTVQTASALNECDRPPSVVSKSVNLTKDLIEVTQYNGSGVKTICSNVQLKDSPREDEKFKYETWTRPSRCKSESRKADSVNLPESSQPRLIRSNSYTLETPSPVLLEHLKNKSQSQVIQKSENSPTIEVYQTDISVQQITLNTSSSKDTDSKSETFFASNPFKVMEPNSDLMNVLKDIPGEYAQQVMDLLKKQHEEQKNRLERYDNIKQDSSEDLIDLQTNQDNQKLRRSSTFSISPSQSLYYSLHSDSDTITPDVTSNGLKDLEIGVLRENNGFLEGIVVCEQQKPVSRELFQDLDPITIKEMRRDKAASVIGAHVRGYLTRRLLNTEKVQYLIATVKDVLLCALELHRSEIIDEKDVELHRRLINQLSAALYSFHEIFFDLSVQDRMAIISADRQRKLEKIKRPQSGRNSARPRSGNVTI